MKALGTLAMIMPLASKGRPTAASSSLDIPAVSARADKIYSWLSSTDRERLPCWQREWRHDPDVRKSQVLGPIPDDISGANSKRLRCFKEFIFALDRLVIRRIITYRLTRGSHLLGVYETNTPGALFF